ncbi:Transcription factor [Sesamum alatum]|uniref:Transcription factor n=1 Tax=Sesamum alatum TaxID=300844 RepID=A0AAE1Z060_9LAMI|nr:Transcription factor [Sesamum alatum]
MADEFQVGSGNWWDTSRTTPPVSISTTLNAIASFGWPTEMEDMKSRSSMDSGAASGGGASLVLQGGHEQASAASTGGGLGNLNLQMVGLGLSSQGMDWNQTLLGEKGESSFRSMLQEDLRSNPSNFQPESAAASQEHWRQKLYSGASPEESSVNDFKQTNRGFSLDQPQFSSQASSNDSTITSQNLITGFQVDAAAAAPYGMLLSENQQHYPYPSSSYCANAVDLIPSWNKFPQFLRTSPPKQPPPPPSASGSHLHFTNNAPFWNASAPPSAVPDGRSNFFPAIQTQNIRTAPSFDEKPKITSEARDLSTTTKKNSTETSNKRPRSNETPSSLPAFKVRKEKMGDRITALQQLVSPFGKTDTASVLSEAIEYIKFLHEQVSVLSTPYMKNGAPNPIQLQHQNSDKSKDPEGGRQDLRSRGLCLVPVSSTFPMTHETTVDFWTPTFGGSFR